MNPKKTLIIFLLALVTSAYAQKADFKKPDYLVIKKNIEDKDSKLYYKKILERLQQHDTLLTGEEYMHIYYGAALQKDYSPYKSSPYEEKMLKYYQSENLTAKDCSEYIALANKSLKEYPLDLRVLNFLAYVHHVGGNELMAKKISYSFQGIVNTILNTGDGRTCETAMHVISVSDEYVVLNVFELESVQQSLIGNCDYLEFEKGKYKVDGLYFDVSKLFEKSGLLLDGK